MGARGSASGIISKTHDGHWDYEFEREYNPVDLVKQMIHTEDDEYAETVANVIASFSGMMYQQVRHDQLNNIPNQAVNIIENFINKAPKWGDSGTLYRGLKLTDSKYKSLMSKVSSGAVISQNTLSSWTSDSRVVHDKFASIGGNSGKHSVVLVNEGGTRTGVSIKYLSNRPNESEVLESNKLRQKAIRSEIKNGRTYIFVKNV